MEGFIGFGMCSVVGFILIVGFFIITSSIRIVQEYERGVIFRLGRLVGA